MRAYKVLLTISCWVFLIPPLTAAELTVRDGVGYNNHPAKIVRLSGPIVSGDASRLARIMKISSMDSSADYDESAPRLIELSSDGGEPNEAIELAKIIRARLALTIVKSGESCRGACGYLFLAGAEPGGDDYIDVAYCPTPGAKVTIELPNITQRLMQNASGNEDLARRTRVELFALLVDFFRLADQHSWPSGLLDSLVSKEKIQEVSVYPGKGTPWAFTMENFTKKGSRCAAYH